MNHVLAPAYEPSFRSARLPASFQNPAKVLSDRDKPLVVDLEGALLSKGLLAEGIGRLLRRNPLMIFMLLLWCVRGRAVLKRNVMARAGLDLAALPVNAEFLGYIRAQSALGREVVLVASVSELSATQILRRFSVFDRAVLFDDSLESFGARRAERLLQCFPKGFHYAGSAMSDRPVWAATDHIILVNPTARVGRAVRIQGRAITQFPQVAVAAAGSVTTGNPPPADRAMIREGMSLALLAACAALAGVQLFIPESTSMLVSGAKLAVPLALAAWLGNTLARNR